VSSRALIVRYSAIGDVVLATAPIVTFARAFPDARVDVLAGSIAHVLLQNNPYIAEVLPIDPKKAFWGVVKEIKDRKYNILINLQGNNRSAFLSMFSGTEVRVGSHSGWSFAYDLFVKDINERKHAVDFYYDVLSLVVPDGPKVLPWIYLLPEEVDAARKMLKDRGVGDRFVCFNPAVSCISREWLPEYYVELGIYIRDRGYDIVLLGGHSEHDIELCGDIASGIGEGAFSLAGGLTLRELAAVSSLCELFFTGDTGPMHIAAAVGTRVVAFFGPSDPVRAHPLGDMHEVFVSGLPCVGCYKKECETRKCMRLITPRMVLSRLGF